MLKEIAEVTGFSFRENDTLVISMLQRIQRKLPAGVDVDSANFAEEVLKAEAAVNAEGQMALASLVKQLCAPPAEKTLKIKSSPKGVRIKIAAANGVRFSFGPIWNESVKKAKGIAVAPVNREKLNHQGILAGVEDPASLDVSALCAKIAATL